ncbi:MAG: signal peptide peptidase SppA [Bacteroidia bacterium]|nr:signal peptide peptidase SppA [Bacteroidia bacterium]MDW8014849.1 signal peptide peptidase SppA [Bacteroidia bacterium]
MWRFLRLLIALILAFFLTMVIGGILLVGALFSGIAVRSAATEKPLDQKGWLHIPLSGELQEYQQDFSDFDIQILFGDLPQRPPTLEELRQALEEAATSDKVRGVILQLGELSARPAQAQQLGRWLLAFKQKSNKPVYAYGDSFSELTYYLASCADTIVMYPRSGAILEWNGLVSQGIFFKKFLQKWGIKPRVFRTGSYKSAGESFTEERYSEPNRAQISALLEDVWQVFIDTIAFRRRLNPDTLRRWAETRVFLSAREAYENRLVDTLLSWHDWIKRFTPEGKDKPSFISVKQLISDKDKKSPNRIALIYAEGDIGPEGSIRAEDLVPVIQKVAREQEIKAAVLRVNSPGGGVLDSDKIARALQALKAKKPVIISMGGVAASGGYYISAYADKIVAELTTITGSIGVIAILLDLQELLEKHVELRADRVAVGGPYADFMSPYRSATPTEIALLQSEIDQIYEEFLEVVREGRRYPSREAVHSIAQGRVWSGMDAQRIGLVDTVGGLETAFALAARQAGVSEYEVEVYPKPLSLIERLLRGFQKVQAWWKLQIQSNSLPERIQFYWEEFIFE